MVGYAKWEGEELEVVFSCEWELCDYGVPRSPVWYEPTNIRIDDVVLLGWSVDIKKLPEGVLKELYCLSEEVEFHRE